MLKEKKTSQALIDETRDAIQQARLAIRHSRQLLTQMKERSELDAATRPPEAVMAEAKDTDIQAAAPRRLITVFGGTGFLGRCVVRHLLGHNFEVRAASRHPERTTSIFEPGKPGPHAVKTSRREPWRVHARRRTSRAAAPIAARSAPMFTVLATNRSDGYNWPVAGRSRPPRQRTGPRRRRGSAPRGPTELPVHRAHQIPASPSVRGMTGAIPLPPGRRAPGPLHLQPSATPAIKGKR